MSEQFPPCPECQSEYTYETGSLLTCPMCGHEWLASGPDEADLSDDTNEVKDAVGNVLQDGDDVTIVKSLKVKGVSGPGIKIGTKVRGIRLIEDSGDGHDIDAKVPGLGPMKLKSSVVKKVT